MRRWLAQADVNNGTRPGVTSEESAEVRRLKAGFKRLREDNEILRKVSISSRGSSTPETADLRVHRRVEESGRPARIADRTITDAEVEVEVRDLAWTFNKVTGCRQMTPECLYGRQKWLALHRRLHTA